jgi:hypothetical protein
VGQAIGRPDVKGTRVVCLWRFPVCLFVLGNRVAPMQGAIRESANQTGTIPGLRGLHPGHIIIGSPNGLPQPPLPPPPDACLKTMRIRLWAWLLT